MGQKYGAVINECLSNVKCAEEFEAKNLFELQDYAMERLHSPLQSMLKSGFNASRSPLGGLRGQITMTRIAPSAGTHIHSTFQDIKSVFQHSTFNSPYSGDLTSFGGTTSFVPMRPAHSKPYSEMEGPTTYDYSYTSTRYSASSTPPVPIKSAAQNIATPSLNTVVEKKEKDERTVEEKLIDLIRQIPKKEGEAMEMLEHINIQERIRRMNEEGPFELSSVAEAEPEKSEGEIATSAHPSTVIEKKEEDERTEEEKTIEWIRQIQKKVAEATTNEEDVKILERIKRMNEEGPFELPIPIEAEFKGLLERERTGWPTAKGFAEGESDSAVSATKSGETRGSPQDNKSHCVE